MAESPTLKEPGKLKPWLRFGLRSLIFSMTIFSVWLGLKVHRVNQQRKAVAVIRSLGGTVTYEHQEQQKEEPDGPRWLRQIIGDDYFVVVTIVSLKDSMATDDDMEYLRPLHKLKWLDLTNTPVGDRGVKKIGSKKDLEGLFLSGTQLTDIGLECLRRFPKLNRLYLTDTNVTDDGMVHISHLANLSSVNMRQVRVGDSGLKHFSRLENLRSIYLNATDITDDGLRHLGGLPNLTSLGLDGTNIKGPGLAHLEKLDLESIALGQTQVTDQYLDHLARHTNLASVLIDIPPASDQGIQKLQESLPKCMMIVNRRKIQETDEASESTSDN